MLVTIDIVEAELLREDGHGGGEAIAGLLRALRTNRRAGDEGGDGAVAGGGGRELDEGDMCSLMSVLNKVGFGGRVDKDTRCPKGPPAPQLNLLLSFLFWGG